MFFQRRGADPGQVYMNPGIPYQGTLGRYHPPDPGLRRRNPIRKKAGLPERVGFAGMRAGFEHSGIFHAGGITTCLDEFGGLNRDQNEI
jgi:hypothetical protein